MFLIIFLEDDNEEKEEKPMRFNVNISGSAKENMSVNKDVFRLWITNQLIPPMLWKKKDKSIDSNGLFVLEGDL